MKKTITKQEQSYINSLLKKRREREIEKVLSVHQQRDRLWMYKEETYIHEDGTSGLDAHIETLKRTRR